MQSDSWVGRPRTPTPPNGIARNEQAHHVLHHMLLHRRAQWEICGIVQRTAGLVTASPILQ